MMAQGKLKVKTNVPSVAAKGKIIGANKRKKGPPVQRRGNAPIVPKKTKLEEGRKLKRVIGKTVNKAMEDELREKALGGKQSLTKKEPTATTATSQKGKRK